MQALNYALVLAALALTVVAGPARAALEIDITRGNVEPLPIAVTDFQGAAGEMQRLGADMSGVIIGNLARSGLFKPLDRKAFLQAASTLQAPRFADWRVIDAQALVTGRVESLADGQIRVEFRLWDVFAGEQMTYSRLEGQQLEEWGLEAD